MRIVALTAEDLDGLWTDIETLARAIGNLEGTRTQERLIGTIYRALIPM